MTKGALTRRAVVFGLPAAVVACGPAEPIWAPEAAVQRARYTHNGPPRLTLFTMHSRKSGAGMHSGLMVSGSERVIFDPAGTFGASTIPERNDVVFGITPQLEQYYMSYHARETFYVSRVDVDVPAYVAEQALQAVKSYGAVPKARCASATSEILSTLPGFGSIRQTMWPNQLEKQMIALSGVQPVSYYEDDADDKDLARAQYEATLRGAARP